MTYNEILACMGFPSYPQLALEYRLPNVFFVTTDEANAIGNSMHFANIGVWQMVVMSCIRLL